MQGGLFTYALLTALATGLLIAAYTDMRRREIDNWLTAAIAIGAPLFWLASGYSFLDVGIQFALAAITLGVLVALFVLHLMGGGDVKLLTALSLWITPIWYVKLIVVMAMAGGTLTFILMCLHLVRKQRGRIAVPYGVAISFAGLWVLAVKHLQPLHSGSFLG